MNEAELIQYYVERLIYQYRGKPNARATIAILVKQLIADGLLRSIEDGFWLDRAVGEQLDILGKYVGLPRNIGPSADKDYFGFHDYVVGQPDNDNGFRDYTDPTVNATGEWYSYLTKTLLKTEVSDSVYTPMIRLKAMVNTWDGTLADAQYILKQFLYTTDAWARLAKVTQLLYNPEFALGLDGWAASAGDTGLPILYMPASGIWSLTGGATARVDVVGTPAAGKVWTLTSSRPIAVTPGHTMAFSAYAQAVGCTTIGVALVFYTALGAEITVTSEVTTTPDVPTQGSTLADYALLTSGVEVPANAATCVLRLRAVADGTTASPWIAVCRADVHEGRAVPAPYGLIFETTGECANRCHTLPDVSGTTGWSADAISLLGPTVALSAETAPNGLLNFGTLLAQVTGTPAAGLPWTVYSYADRFPVLPGQRIDTSVYLRGAGVTKALLVVAFRSGGSALSSTVVASLTSLGIFAGPGTLDGYYRVEGFATVPAGADEAYLLIAAFTDGTEDPWVALAKPVIQVAADGQTVNADWSPGLESLGGDEATVYRIEADLGLDPTTLVPYLPRKVGTAVRLTYSKPGLAATDYTSP